MKILSAATLALLVSQASITFAFSRLQIPGFGPEVSNIVDVDVTSPIEYMTLASNEDPKEIALKFALERMKTENGFSYVVKDSYKSDFSQITHVYLKQTLNSVEVVNGDMNINVDQFGRVISYGSSFYSGSSVEDINIASLNLKKQSTGGDELVFNPSSGDIISPAQAIVKLSDFLHIPYQAGQELRAEQMSESVLGTEVDSTVFGNIDTPIFKVNHVPFTNDGSALVTTKYLIVNEPEYKMVPVWDINVDLLGGENWYSTQMDMKSGKVLQLIDWVNDATFNVFPIGVNDPYDGNRTIVINPENKLASPLGWNTQKNTRKGDHGFFKSTIGNNVYAQSNPSGRSGYEHNYRPEGNGTTQEDLSFDFALDLKKEPSTYIDAAVTNLFYWNNIMHDVFYQYGFDEVSGNFQEENFGRGGKGNDAVIANAQDGSGYNNANFATPPDGQKPRMRMYVWTQTKPYHDGDLEAGIIIHEYAHGITIRLTGGPQNSNCLMYGESGGMGEGWGDWFSLLLRMRPEYNSTMDFPMGSYSASRGIRPFPYSTSLTTNPHTYAWIQKPGYGGVHAKGSVWATILYEVYWDLTNKYGFHADWYAIKTLQKSELKGNLIALQLIVDGLKLQPCRPTFIDARNAIIKADEVSFNGEHVCLLWKAFAKRGLGSGAKAGGSESFEVPAECN